MRAAVPTGTVLFVTTIASGRKCGARESTTFHRIDKSAEPSIAGGVPTAKNTMRAVLTAASRSVVKCNRAASKLRDTNSESPGS